MDRKIFEEYAQYKIEIKKLTEKMELIQPLVMQWTQELIHNDPEGRPPELEGIGTFSLVEMKKWKPTPEMEELKEKIKRLESREKATRDPDEINYVLKFNQTKDK